MDEKKHLTWFLIILHLFMLIHLLYRSSIYYLLLNGYFFLSYLSHIRCNDFPIADVALIVRCTNYNLFAFLFLDLREHLWHKNRLQEYTQRSGIPFPEYRTINEGAQHAPAFRSTVFVDGAYYTTPITFSNRKAAEQEAARVAWYGVKLKIKDEGYSLICKV